MIEFLKMELIFFLMILINRIITSNSHFNDNCSNNLDCICKGKNEVNELMKNAKKWVQIHHQKCEQKSWKSIEAIYGYKDQDTGFVFIKLNLQEINTTTDLPKIEGNLQPFKAEFRKFNIFRIKKNKGIVLINISSHDLNPSDKSKYSINYVQGGKKKGKLITKVGKSSVVHIRGLEFDNMNREDIVFGISPTAGLNTTDIKAYYTFCAMKVEGKFNGIKILILNYKMICKCRHTESSKFWFLIGTIITGLMIVIAHSHIIGNARMNDVNQKITIKEVYMNCVKESAKYSYEITIRLGYPSYNFSSKKSIISLYMADEAKKLMVSVKIPANNFDLKNETFDVIFKLFRKSPINDIRFLGGRITPKKQTSSIYLFSAKILTIDSNSVNDYQFNVNLVSTSKLCSVHPLSESYTLEEEPAIPIPQLNTLESTLILYMVFITATATATVTFKAINNWFNVSKFGAMNNYIKPGFLIGSFIEVITIYYYRTFSKRYAQIDELCTQGKETSEIAGRSYVSLSKSLIVILNITLTIIAVYNGSQIISTSRLTEFDESASMILLVSLLSIIWFPINIMINSRRIMDSIEIHSDKDATPYSITSKNPSKASLSNDIQFCVSKPSVEKEVVNEENDSYYYSILSVKGGVKSISGYGMEEEEEEESKEECVDEEEISELIEKLKAQAVIQRQTMGPKFSFMRPMLKMGQSTNPNPFNNPFNLPNIPHNEQKKSEESSKK